MVLTAVVSIIRSEIAARLRDLKRSAIAGITAGVLLAAALVFALIAPYIYLTDVYGDAVAALVMAGALLVLGIAALLIAGMDVRRRRDLQSELRSAVTAQLRDFSPARAETTSLLTVLGIAFVLGLVAGRRNR